jgi:hypothetical protein
LPNHEPTTPLRTDDQRSLHPPPPGFPLVSIYYERNLINDDATFRIELTYVLDRLEDDSRSRTVYPRSGWSEDEKAKRRKVHGDCNEAIVLVRSMLGSRTVRRSQPKPKPAPPS